MKKQVLESSMGKVQCFVQIYKIIKRITKGKVATYGQVGKLLQISPRMVGWALHRNPDPKNIPCHRVVNRDGRVAESYAFGGWRVQKRRLEKEGVGFRNELRVDLEKHCWKKTLNKDVKK